ncbi:MULTISPECIES: DUF4442 domain-containing protein [Corynebacterium]|uniref:Acyl-coenzyme A thioesterase PaaI-like protein n=1 Tax=Corynebacterium freneyi TaxID=134034 RepID=A0ABS4U5Z8_9CORY|nr:MULTISPECIES: DUF4442 domain-containing protein [Corynebacterium]MBP2332074.1 acyl-coenzyme A thioesterase PaaI-like protein [Corynebacterium freneyi]MCG7438321.1 DUF4442 domain-containing protein [Corynebacterium freneyi]OFU54995.1 tetrameric acyl-CoA thioesterase [Corynebacterium sp. HMSC11E11]QXA53691.1 DUF4442 domain-containing protein [Corynebacterium freneyi]UBI01740.1 DUF4442 domain-containing protein [Corynebacterium freneyi]
MRLTPRQLKRLMWLWPPYLGAGVRVEEAADDGTRIVVKHRLRPWTANAVGTVFGGTMQSMTDPFFMILAMHQLGPGYRVWDTEASIEFLKPGRGTIRAIIEMPADVIDEIRAETADGDKHLRWFDCDIVDEEGDVVARVRKRLYFRKAPPKN